MATHFSFEELVRECDFCGRTSLQADGDGHWIRITRNDGTWDMCPICGKTAERDDWMSRIHSEKTWSIVSAIYREEEI